MSEKIRIESISLDNFQSYDKETITFPSVSGFYFITGNNQQETEMGRNGIGKSSILDAICWGFYGKTVAGFKATNIISWAFDRKSASVTIVTNKGTAIRQQNPNSLSWDGRIIDQEQLDRILGVTFDQFIIMALHGQGKDLFLENTGADQSEFLTKILNLGRWDEYQKKAKELKKLSGEKQHSVKLSIENLSGQIMQLESISWDKRIQDWEITNETEKIYFDKQIKKLSDEITTLSNRLEEVKEELASFKPVEEITPDHEISKLKEKITLYTSQKIEYTSKKKDLASKIDFFTSVSVCPSCLQSVDKEFTKKTLSQLENELAECNENIEFSTERLNKISNKLTELKEDHAKRVDEFNKKRMRMTALSTELGISKNILDSKAREHMGLLATRKTLNEKINPYLTQKSEDTAKLTSLNSNKKDLEQELIKSGEEDLAYGIWINGFRDIKVNQYVEFLKALEEEGNRCLMEAKLYAWKYLVTYSTNSAGNTTISIEVSHNGKIAPLGRFSGGEGVRLKALFQMALGRILEASSGVSWDIEMWDEPFSFISSEGINSLLDILHEYAKISGKRVILIDHSVLEYGGFDGTLFVTKNEKGSTTTGIFE